MSRRRLIETCEFPYHITNRSNNGEAFYLAPPILWNVFNKNLATIVERFACEVHAFVMMSNHYHLIVSTPNSNIGECMEYFDREVARAANKLAGRINHFFGGRYKWSLIAGEKYYWNAVKYVFRNPVRAGICKKVEEYAFSTLNTKPEGFGIVDLFSPNSGSVEFASEWLNEPFEVEQEEAIRKALRRKRFKIPRGRGGKPVRFDDLRCKKGGGT